MMNNGTKQHIDAARQVLVGKVPDPKAQVEQITNALIYKFMSDMDLQSVEVGGKASFFVEGYEQYAWQKLLDLRLSGQERMDLYVRGLDSMATNPHLPELFRAIMKGAFLPYRDPETLNLFLKEINWFTYEHSENLGDAYEYLLSVLGSQGAAGQFRTPRHIIDFMVAVMQPQKDEKILDPACGTAGFLISAYKYIAAQHQEKELTPDEKQKLASNLVGYDISPDMVRISQVNMYLHNFPDPQIYEYDTLTSEARWDDDFDLIMANPPFMSPKGGIRPHQRFAIQANRSEVLFVDYIMEHLTLHGRAAVIVPEGIIFQSNNAYKGLRKMLVEENYLYAVVSLPAGVFQPYSGVKTSILFMDRDFAKRSDSILFVDVQNDGFGLGAQRRDITENDLPIALNTIINFKNFPRKDLNNTQIAYLAKKTIIADDGNYIFSYSKYKEVFVYDQIKWDMKKIGDVCHIERGASPRPIKKFITTEPNGINWIKIGDVEENSKYIVSSKEKISQEGSEKSKRVYEGDFLLSNSMSFGRPYILKINGCVHDGWLILRILDKKILDKEYLYYILRSKNVYKQFNRDATGGVVRNLNSQLVSNVNIPIPPLEIQQKIVEELDGYQKIIDGARMVVENWKPHIDINPDWEMVELGEVCEFNPKKSEVKKISEDTLVSFVPMQDINEHRMDFSPQEKRKLKDVYSSYTFFKDGDVLLARVTPCFENGKSGIARNLMNGIGFGSSEFFVYRPKQELVYSEWIYFWITEKSYIDLGKNNMSGTSGLQRLTKDFALTYKIPLPKISEQKVIVERIEEEQKIIKMNKELIELFEKRIEGKISKIWGEEQ
ncbi:MAG TPA: N-6 DNA methylase [Anaerolineaceae bacterium]|nr:N-6 DNA methylase [Anaerolineaceae bacterium]